MNMEELLLPPTDAAAYMQNLMFAYDEFHTEELSAWGLLDTMFSVVPDKLAGVKRGFIRTANGIEMVQTTPEQERAVQSKREEFGAAFAAALLPWLAGWEQVYINTRNLDVLDMRPWHEYGVTILCTNRGVSCCPHSCFLVKIVIVRLTKGASFWLHTFHK